MDGPSAFDSLSAGPPLAGIGVAELSGGVAVRYCGRLFAALGASVVRVGGRDDLDPHFAEWLDQGKQTLDTADDALAALVGADVEHSIAVAGQGKAEIAVAEARLSALRQRPTLLAISWFDPRGPYRDWQANDALMQAMTGIAFSFGEADGPPLLPQGVAPQILGGLTGFIAALGSTFDRARRVERIDASILEAALCFLETGAVGTAA